MKLRITVDRQAGMSHIYLPTKRGGEIAFTTYAGQPEIPHRTGAAVMCVDITEHDEMHGIEIDGVITGVEIEDITERGRE